MTADPDPLADFHCVLRDDTYIGFFKIDRDFSRMLKRFAQGTFGLRGILIGGQYQGFGYGTALLQALPAYLRNTYPSTTDMWLTVDKTNDHAIRCYQKYGWVITGPERIRRSGPEHVMKLAL